MIEEGGVERNNYYSKYDNKYDGIKEHDKAEILRSLINELYLPKKDPDTSNNWIIIVNPVYEKIILESYFDSDKRKIIEKATEEPKTIMEILAECNIAQTSAYRKVTSLIQKGLMIPAGYVFSSGRRIMKYKPVFENIQINIMKNKIIIKVKLTKITKK